VTPDARYFQALERYYRRAGSSRPRLDALTHMDWERAAGHTWTPQGVRLVLTIAGSVGITDPHRSRSREHLIARIHSRNPRLLARVP